MWINTHFITHFAHIQDSWFTFIYILLFFTLFIFNVKVMCLTPAPKKIPCIYEHTWQIKHILILILTDKCPQTFGYVVYISFFLTYSNFCLFSLVIWHCLTWRWRLMHWPGMLHSAYGYLLCATIYSLFYPIYFLPTFLTFNI